jgi:hypothetical protein
MMGRVQHRAKTKNVGTLPPLSSLNFLTIRDQMLLNRLRRAGCAWGRFFDTRGRDLGHPDLGLRGDFA